jgi:hypothetical protein
MFAPAIAAFIVRRFITHEGFATAGLRRGPWRPYLAVWIGVPLLIAGIYGLTLVMMERPAPIRSVVGYAAGR